MLTREELYHDLVGLANSFDNYTHVDDVIYALGELIDRLYDKGLAEGTAD